MYVRYAANAGQCQWPITFAFERTEEIGCRLLLPDGRERELRAEREFLVLEGQVFCIVPAGHGLLIYLKGSRASGHAGHSCYAGILAGAHPAVCSGATNAGSATLASGVVAVDSGQPDSGGVVCGTESLGGIDIASQNDPRGTLAGGASHNMDLPTANVVAGSNAASGIDIASQNDPRGTLADSTTNNVVGYAAGQTASLTGNATAQIDNACQNDPRGTLVNEASYNMDTPLSELTSAANGIDNASQNDPRGTFEQAFQNDPRGTLGQAVPSLQSSQPAACQLDQSSLQARASQPAPRAQAVQPAQLSQTVQTAAQIQPAQLCQTAQANQAVQQVQTAEPDQTAILNQLALLASRLDSLDRDAAIALRLEQAKAEDARLAEVKASGEVACGAIASQADNAIASIETVRQAASASFLTEASSVVDRALAASQELGCACEAAEARVAGVLARLEERIAELERQNTQLSLQAEGRIAQATNAALTNIEAAKLEVATQNAARASLEGSPWPSEGYWTQLADIPKGTLLTLPDGLCYYPGRHSLRLAINGYTLIPGRDFEEHCTGNHPSTTIRILLAAKKGDIWSIYIVPTNSLQAVLESANEARLSAQEAELAASTAASANRSVQELANQTLTAGTANLNAIKTQGDQAVRKISIARDNCLDELADAAGKVRSDCVNVWQAATGEIKKEAEASSQAARLLWQKAQADVAEARIDALQKAEAVNSQIGLKSAAAAESAADALDLARCVWRAAFNVAVDNAKPGLASVPCLNDLLVAASGIYIINPHLICKTPFMGVWPVASIDGALWDGFFFIGQPYPDKPINPLDPDDPLAPELPPYPEDPSIVPDMQPIASGSEWLPCDHTHNQE